MLLSPKEIQESAMVIQWTLTFDFVVAYIYLKQSTQA